MHPPPAHLSFRENLTRVSSPRSTRRGHGLHREAQAQKPACALKTQGSEQQSPSREYGASSGTQTQVELYISHVPEQHWLFCVQCAPLGVQQAPF